MNLSKLLKNGSVKVLVMLVMIVGMLTAATGCDFDDYYGSGFRMGNFNQGHRGGYDCVTNPLAPWC